MEHLDRSDAQADLPVRTGPWQRLPATPGLGGPDFGELVDAMRLLQDRFITANVPHDQTSALAHELRQVADRLERWEVGERQSGSGTRDDLPARGSILFPPFVYREATAWAVHGEVTFRGVHLGGNGAAHGGAISLLFDDVLGRLCNSPDRPIARTAFLKVKYRNVTPIDTPLLFDASLDRIDGRKRWATARLHAGESLLADAEGLFVELRPGQP